MRIKLCTEMIPQAQHGSNLRELLTASEWDKCKQFVAKRSRSRCEICNGVGPAHPVECHEIWSYNYDMDIYDAVHRILCSRYSSYIKGQTSLPIRKSTKNIVESKYIFPLLFGDLTVGQWNNISHQSQCATMYTNLKLLRTSRVTTMFSMLSSGNGVQSLRGLIALCPSCHLAKHYGFASVSNKAHIADNQLKRVNEWNDGQLKSYLNYKIAQWDARNKSDWTLNIDWIFKYIQLSDATIQKLGYTGTQNIKTRRTIL